MSVRRALIGIAVAFLCGSQPAAKAQKYPDTKEFSISAALTVQGEEGYRKLIARSKSKDAKIRYSAYCAMGNSRDPRFLPVVLSVFNDQDFWVAMVAHDAVKAQPDEAKPILMRLSTSGVAGAVGGFRYFQPAINPFLESLLRNKSEGVRAEALTLLYSIGTARAMLADSSKRVLRVAAAIMLYSMDSTEATAHELYCHKNVRVRAAAAEVTQRGTPQDARIWIDLSRENNVEVLKYALIHLGYSLGQKQNFEHLEEGIRTVEAAFRDTRRPVIQAAAIAVKCWIGVVTESQNAWPENVVEMVHRVAQNRRFRDEVYRQAVIEKKQYMPAAHYMGVTSLAAYEALAFSRDERALAFLKTLLEPYVKAEVVESIGRLGTEEAWQFLSSMLERGLRDASPKKGYGDAYTSKSGGSSTVKGMALCFPNRVPSRVFDIISDERIPEERRRPLAFGLHYFQIREVATFLLNLADNPDTMMRWAAFNSLSYVADPRVGPVLDRISKEDPDDMTRRIASGALETWRRETSGKIRQS